MVRPFRAGARIEPSEPYEALKDRSVARSPAVMPPRWAVSPAIWRKVHIPWAVCGPQIPSTGPVGIANFVRIVCASAISPDVAAWAGGARPASAMSAAMRTDR